MNVNGPYLRGNERAKVSTVCGIGYMSLGWILLPTLESMWWGLKFYQNLNRKSVVVGREVAFFHIMSG